MGATRKKHENWSRLTRKMLLVVTLVALLASACSSSADTATDASAEAVTESSEDAGFFDEEEAFEDEAFEEEAEFAGDAEAPADTPANENQLATGSAAAAQTPTDLGRDIIFTAQVTVDVDDVSTSGRQATEIITELGGFVFGEESQGGAEPRTTLIFKVRPDDFSEALEALGGIGELTAQRITTDDVTERVVDLQSRIETTELGVARLRTAMEATTNLNDFAQLEQQLLSRESDLEVLRGTLRTLRDQIDLATITLTITQQGVRNRIGVLTTRYEGFDAGIGCPGNDGGRFEPGDELTLCFEVTNNGDQNLTDVAVTDSVLEIDGDDLTVVFGDPDDLAPGQSVIFSHELEVDRSVSLRLSATATPTNGTTNEAAGPAVRTSSTPQIQVDVSAVDAGFGDGFDAALRILARLWVVAQVLLGFVLPLLVFLPLIWLALKGLGALRRRSTAGDHAGGNSGSDGDDDPSSPNGTPGGDSDELATTPPPPAPVPV